jgi:hypothetical protein
MNYSERRHNGLSSVWQWRADHHAGREGHFVWLTTVQAIPGLGKERSAHAQGCVWLM